MTPWLLLVTLAHADPVDELRAAARAAQSSGDCVTARERWLELIEAEGDDLEAWKAIAQCQPGGEIDAFVEGAAEVIQESFILKHVPVALDHLRVKELVPILSRVETQESKDLSDYLLLSELHRRLDNPAAALAALDKAISLKPEDAGLRLEYGELLFQQGRVSEAREAYRAALAGASPSLAAAYGAAMGWPWLFLLGTLGLTGAALGFRLRSASDWTPSGKRQLAGLVLAAGLVCALEFLFAGQRVAFLALSLSGVVGALWLAGVPFRERLHQLGSGSLGVLAAVATGRIYRRLNAVPLWGRGAVLLACGLAVVFALPRVGQGDLRVALAFLLSMLFFATVGSLLLTLLELSASLRVSLRGIAFASTLPFLALFLYVERQTLAHLLTTGAFLDPMAWERTVAYLLVWGLGTGLALMMARILSRSILDPVRAIDDAVLRIRAGDFSARAEVERRDELGALATAVGDMADGLAQRERIKDTFRRYVDPRVAERLIAGDVGMNQGRRRHAAVLFADVRGFTTLSEQVEPEVMVEVLNEVFTRLAPVVSRWGGVVDKYMGDAMMAVWGVPEPLATGPHAGEPVEVLAVEAGLEMLAELDALRLELEARGLPGLRLGLGVNAGPVIAGPIGSAERREYTVIGDVVNTAQRAEGMARELGRLLVTEAVVEATAGRFEVVEVEAQALKGKAERVRLWRVEGRAGQAEG